LLVVEDERKEAAQACELGVGGEGDVGGLVAAIEGLPALDAHLDRALVHLIDAVARRVGRLVHAHNEASVSDSAVHTHRAEKGLAYEKEQREPDDETEDEEEAHADEQLDPEGLRVARLAPASLPVGVTTLDLEQIRVPTSARELGHLAPHKRAITALRCASGEEGERERVRADVQVLDLEPFEEVEGGPVDGPVEDGRQLIAERNRAVGDD
jgi:hypothetical protein